VESDDPSDIRVLAVTTDDVVTAIEANERREAGAVLRVTPPFSGRMRARLHLDGTESEYGDPSPLHVPPERLVESVPAFPSPDDTEDELRSDPGTSYSPERHRITHEAAVEGWRERVGEAVSGEAVVSVPGGSHRVRIATLG
jgi:hypothetical protein